MKLNIVIAYTCGLIMGILITILAFDYQQEDNIVIGSRVTNGICEGLISARIGQEAKIIYVTCSNGITFNFIWEKITNLKEL